MTLLRGHSLLRARCHLWVAAGARVPLTPGVEAAVAGRGTAVRREVLAGCAAAACAAQSPGENRRLASYAGQDVANQRTHWGPHLAEACVASEAGRVAA